VVENTTSSGRGSKDQLFATNIRPLQDRPQHMNEMHFVLECHYNLDQRFITSKKKNHFD